MNIVKRCRLLPLINDFRFIYQTFKYVLGRKERREKDSLLWENNRLCSDEKTILHTLFCKNFISTKSKINAIITNTVRSDFILVRIIDTDMLYLQVRIRHKLRDSQ